MYRPCSSTHLSRIPVLPNPKKAMVNTLHFQELGTLSCRDEPSRETEGFLVAQPFLHSSSLEDLGRGLGTPRLDKVPPLPKKKKENSLASTSNTMTLSHCLHPWLPVIY